MQETGFRVYDSAGIGQAGFSLYDGGVLTTSVEANAGITTITGVSTGQSILRLHADRVQIRNEGATQSIMDTLNTPNGVEWGSLATGISHYQYERASAGADITGAGQWWVRNDTPNVPMFTDDAGNDWQLNNVGAQATTISTGWTTGTGGSITISANAPLIHTEQSASDSPGAGEGQFWVRDDAPNRAMFTDDAGNDKVLSPIGTLGDIQYAAPTSAFTLSNASGVQSALPAAIDTFTLEANSTYEFEGVYLIASGTTAHTVAMAFAITGASVTDINYVTDAWNSAANAIATAGSRKHTNAVASTVVTASTTNPRQHIRFKGIIRVTTGGTVVPQIAFSAAPGGTNQMLIGSFIQFKRLGSDTEQTTGGFA